VRQHLRQEPDAVVPHVRICAGGAGSTGVPTATKASKVNIIGWNALVIGPYLKVVGEYMKSLENFPNPKAVNMTEFGKVNR
jgi:hypothetical protein